MRKEPALEVNPTPAVTGSTGICTILYVRRSVIQTSVSAVLSVSRNDEGVSLERILPDWTVIARATVDSALSLLREIALPILLCDTDLTAGTWLEMLEHISRLPDPPLLIVTSRLADEHLWAEALNLGAWDVLAKPFDATEVIRIVSCAWQHWRERHGIQAVRTAQRKAATGAKHMSATGT